MGQEMLSDNTQKDFVQISFNRFTAGIYIVEIKTQSGRVLREKVKIE